MGKFTGSFSLTLRPETPTKLRGHTQKEGMMLGWGLDERNRSRGRTWKGGEDDRSVLHTCRKLPNNEKKKSLAESSRNIGNSVFTVLIVKLLVIKLTKSWEVGKRRKKVCKEA